MKKILSLAVVALLVVTMTVTAFAATANLGSYDLTADVVSIPFALPEGLTLETGDVVTVHIKGTASNEAVRFYFTQESDGARVCDVVVVEVVDGAFETTVDVTIVADGSIQGSAAPTILLVKGPSYGVNLTDVSVEVVEITSDKITAEAPADDTTTEETPAVEEAPAVETVAVAYIDGKTPSYTYTVTGEVDTITASITTCYEEGASASWNEWCGEVVVVTAPDGTVHYYDWGGASVNWPVDVDGDGTDDVFGNMSDSWLGEVVDGSVELTIPVYGPGTTIGFIVNSWDTYTGNQFEITLTGDKAAPVVEEAPAEDTTTEAPAEDDTTTEAPADEEPADTGLALAVVPAIVALAAVALSKKR